MWQTPDCMVLTPDLGPIRCEYTDAYEQGPSCSHRNRDSLLQTDIKYI